MNRQVLAPSSLPRPSSATLSRRRGTTHLHCLIIGVMMAVVAPIGIQASEILVVLSADKTPYHQAEESVKKELTGKGHTCQTVLLDQLGKGDAASLAHSDAFVAIGTTAASWLHEHLPSGKPLAYCMVSDAVAAGLESPPPATGVTTEVPIASQLALIAEALPNARTLGMLYRSDNDRSQQLLTHVRAALPPGWKIEAIAIDQYRGAAAAIDALMEKGIDLVWTAPDNLIYNEPTVRSLLLSAMRSRVPVFGYSVAFVNSGALFGIGINPTTQGNQAALIISGLLAQKDPSTLPPKPAVAFEIAVNPAVAQRLGIDLPKPLVAKATPLSQNGR